MYCPKCGWKNDDNAEKCANCFTDLKEAQNQAQQPEPTQQMPGPPQQPPQPPYGQQYPPYQSPYSPNQQPYEPTGPIPDYLTWSIVVTVLSALCCSPFTFICGAVAIVFSSMASSKKSIGDYEAAMNNARWARGLLIAAAVLFVIGIAFSFIWGFFGAFSGFRHYPGGRPPFPGRPI